VKPHTGDGVDETEELGVLFDFRVDDDALFGGESFEGFDESRLVRGRRALFLSGSDGSAAGASSGTSAASCFLASFSRKARSIWS